MHPLTPYLCLLLFLPALPAHADAYKCRLPDGGVEISSTPCKGAANTMAVRPTETVDETARLQAERDFARIKEYAENQSADIRTRQAEAEKKYQEEQLHKARLAVSRSTSREACLEILASHTVDDDQGKELLAECRGKPMAVRAPNQPDRPVFTNPAPSYPDWTTQCIQQVLAQRLPPQIQQQRLLSCQGSTTVNRPQRPESRPEPRPAPRPEIRPEAPVRAIEPKTTGIKPCPPNDRYCVR